MGVFEENFERVGCQIGEIVYRQFFQRPDHFIGFFRGFGGEGVGLEFVFAGQNVSGDAEDHADRRIEETEEDQSSIERGAVNAEGFVEAGTADEEGEDEKHQQ